EINNGESITATLAQSTTWNLVIACKELLDVFQDQINREARTIEAYFRRRYTRTVSASRVTTLNRSWHGRAKTRQ
ncbi:unnamed protein product, partial [Mycena citricolor]